MKPQDEDRTFKSMGRAILKKTDDHVGISGPYTKRQLRKLLDSSSPSLRYKEVAGNKSKEREIIEKSKKHESIEKSKKRESIEKSEKRESIGKSKKREIIKKQKKKDNKRRKRKVKLYSKKCDERRRTLDTLLHERKLSKDFGEILLKEGLTPELIRLLKALGSTEEDIEKLKKMGEDEDKYEESESGESLTFKEDSLTSTESSESLEDFPSNDNLYLKMFFEKPLRDALREIVLKKPYDPVEYLAHRLLHLKICEERRKRRKEWELELAQLRERLKLMKGKEIDDVIDLYEQEEEEEEEEELQTDWNFINLEEL